MEITVKGNKITLKKDYLTNGEVNYIVGEVLKIYDNSGDIEGYDYSPLTMITNFYALLFGFCIEGYNIDSDEDYNKYYNIGTHYELLRIVTNADEAYHLMMSLSKQIISVENIVDKINEIYNLGFVYSKTETKTKHTDDDKAEAICLGLAYIKDNNRK